MTKEAINVAVLFADIAKSTQLYDQLGDTVANTIIRDCISILSKVTYRFNGTVIKSIGDEILCTFQNPSTAVNAGKAMHESIDQLEYRDNPDFSSPNIYVGIHYGPVIEEGGDIFGDTVNITARLVSIAKQRQIIISEQTVKLLSEELSSSTKYIDKVTFKGKSGVINIYEVVWEQEDLTVMSSKATGRFVTNKRAGMGLILRYNDSITTVEQSRPSVTLGRQSHNDIIVSDSHVSRSHAKIEYRRGKFVIIDQSTNGTYVHEKGKKLISLTKIEMPLNGSGIISLGRKPETDLSFAIHYEIKNIHSTSHDNTT